MYGFGHWSACQPVNLSVCLHANLRPSFGQSACQPISPSVCRHAHLRPSFGQARRPASGIAPAVLRSGIARTPDRTRSTRQLVIGGQMAAAAGASAAVAAPTSSGASAALPSACKKKRASRAFLTLLFLDGACDTLISVKPVCMPWTFEWEPGFNCHLWYYGAEINSCDLFATVHASVLGASVR
jgi:hypothetical protein